MKTKFNGILMLLLALLVQISFAQEKTISGTVSDESGPLPGVNVIIKGTTTGTQTDFDGNYTLKANTGDVLVFSYVGMNNIEKTVGASNTIDVVMTSSNVLEEVVVVGYGERSQKELTTNVSQVKAEEVQKISVANLSGALQGMATGVQIQGSSGAPGGEIRMRIRGASSINGSNNPLFVIDGVPVFSGATLSESFGGQTNSALSNLNPDDIESFDILKDAAASAIYGDRGSNGVVLITTKRGKQGKARININSYVGVQNPINKYEKMNYGEWLKFGDAYYENSGRFPSGYWSTVWDGTRDFRGESPESLNEFYNSVADQGDNYLDKIYVDNAIVKNIGVNISGGNENTRYYVGATQYNQEGVLLAQNYERKGIRLNLEQKLSDKFKLIGGISLTDEYIRMVTNDNNIYGVLSTALLEAPGNNIYNEDGSFSGGWIFSNPAQNAIDDQGTGRSFRILGNIDLQYELADGLMFTSKYGIDQLEFKEDQYNPSTSSQGAGSNGYAYASHTTRRKFITTQGFNYNKTFFDDLEIRAFLAGEFESNSTEFLAAAATNFASPLLRYVSEGAEIDQADASYSEDRRYAVISRFGATYLDKFIVEASLRADATSRFGQDNRWGYFPAVSLGYIMSEESWFENDLVNFMKLRASWGETGNGTALGRYEYQPAVTSVTYAGNPGSNLLIANPGILWETTTQYDAGISFALLDNRIKIDYAYYYKQTKDDSLILDAPNAESQGGGAVIANVGEIRNQGHEVDISATVFDKEFKWNTSIGFSTLDNEVTSLGGTAPFNTGFVSRVEEGATLGAFYVLESDGLYQDISEVPANLQAQGVGPGDVKYIDQNGDGLINDDDFIIAGDPFGDYTVYWRNDISYKNFDLSFLWDASVGNDVYNNNYQFAGTSSNRIFGKFKSALDYWTPTNTDTDLPRPNVDTGSYNNQDATRFIEDGSYIKLRNITFGYTLPQIKGIDNLRVYLSADNLLLFTDYSGLDPEVNFGGSQSITGATDFLTQGSNVTWKFGVNISL